MARAHRAWFLLLAAALAACLEAGVQASEVLPYKSIIWKPDLSGAIVQLELNVTLFQAAPNCFSRPVLLVNGIFEPTIEVAQGDVVKVKWNNRIPKSYPSVIEGFSIHYHGLAMRGSAAWLDGVSYVNQCPIAPGTSFEYQFEITDPPGSYLWHDHSGGWKGDGLSGPFVVRPRRIPPALPSTRPKRSDYDNFGPDLWQYDEERVIFIADWYNSPMSTLLMRLNAPFDPNKASSNTGNFTWVGNPQSILVNGKGFYGDCPLYPVMGGGGLPTCNPSTLTILPGRSAQQPWASANNPGCGHDVIKIQRGKTYRMRVISSTMLSYTTVCFEGHTVQIIAADTTPTDPVYASCIDLNTAERLDVLLTANASPSNYWITVIPQYRPGSPSGFAVLHYEGFDNVTIDVPKRPPAPSNTSAWTLEQAAKLVARADLLSPSTIPAAGKQYLRYGQSSLAPPAASDKVYQLNFSQPLIQADGSIKWALNNVAMPANPPCTPLMTTAYRDPRALQQAAVSSNSSYNGTQGLISIYQGDARSAPIYVAGWSPVPVYPSLGRQVVVLEGWEVVDLVVNNGPANRYNGDYRSDGASRNASEQHPFHLHGHHFWILGRGMGIFNPATDSAGLNTANPILRDMVTVPMYGWAVIRFRANNPGVWPFHCHILPHAFMGMAVHFVEDYPSIERPPKNPPACPKTCRYTFAPYAKDWLMKEYGSSGWEIPPTYEPLTPLMG